MSSMLRSLRCRPLTYNRPVTFTLNQDNPCVGPTIVVERRVNASERHGLMPLSVALFSIASACSLAVDEHRLTVRNETGLPVDGLVVAIKSHEMPVGRLTPGASTVLTMRLNAESHWDIFLVRGNTRKHLGTCGYTGTTPGRPTEHTLRVVQSRDGDDHDCIVALG